MFEPINLDYEAIGRRAKQRRQELGLKQEEVAEICELFKEFKLLMRSYGIPE